MVPDIWLRAGVPRLVSGLGTSFLLLRLFGFEVLGGSRACSVGVLHFLRLSERIQGLYRFSDQA